MHNQLIGSIGTGINITQQRQTFFEAYPLEPLARTHQDVSDIYLSKKEVECIRWMIAGKSSGEIANILSISKRTVETHMNNIKQKLNCYKQFQVGYLIGKYGYLLL